VVPLSNKALMELFGFGSTRWRCAGVELREPVPDLSAMLVKAPPAYTAVPFAASA